MEYLDLSLPTPAGNLACDEALLDLCETQETLEILRFWESPQHFVVLGYGNLADGMLSEAVRRLREAIEESRRRVMP